MTAIITNNKPRHIIYGYELTDKQAAEFDYLDADELQQHSFFIYKGDVYDLGEFMRVTDTMANCHGFGDWDGFYSDSFFSGVLIKYAEGMESIIVARYYA